jgi:hypothetical protein
MDIPALPKKESLGQSLMTQAIVAAHYKMRPPNSFHDHLHAQFLLFRLSRLSR